MKAEGPAVCTARSTFLKLAVVILALGACACALLAARQLRLQAAHELARARVRLLAKDAELWRVRAEIAARVTPDRIGPAANDVVRLQSMTTGRESEQRIVHNGAEGGGGR